MTREEFRERCDAIEASMEVGGSELPWISEQHSKLNDALPGVADPDLQLAWRLSEIGEQLPATVA